MSTIFNLIFTSFILLYLLIIKTNHVDCLDTTHTNLTYIIDINLTDSKEFKNDIYQNKINLSPTSKYIFRFYDYMKNLDISFLIFQVHTFNDTILLSYNNEVTYNGTICGTNVGLHSSRKNKITFYVINEKIKNVLAYISVLAYTFKDTIPGGCNMVYPIPISPYLTSELLDYDDPLELRTSAAPAGRPNNKLCTTSTGLIYTYYYLELSTLTEESYFDALAYMLTVKNIMNTGTNAECYDLNCFFGVEYNKTLLIALVVKTSDGTGASAYVPLKYYFDVKDSIIGNKLTQSSCGFLLIIGIFLCYFGHYYFKSEMFLMAYLAGVVISYIVVPMIFHLDKSGVFWLSLAIGICCGSVWLLVWMLYGIPLVSVTLATLNMGFLVASLIYKFTPDLILDEDTHARDLIFWTLFVTIMLITSGCLLLVAYHANLLICAVLGGFAAVYSIDVFIGSHFKFIIIDILRRTKNSFHHNYVLPPFGRTENSLILFWLLLAVTGYLVQYYHNREKSTFPPPPRSSRSRAINQAIVPRSYGTAGLNTSRKSVGNSSTNEYSSLLN